MKGKATVKHRGFSRDLWVKLASHSAFFPILVFLMSFSLRATWASFATVTPVSDCHGYDILAQGLANGEDFGDFNGESHGKAYRTPGYPAFLALVYVLFGHSYTAVALAQAFVSALTTLFIFLLSLKFVGRRASLLAAGLHLFSPTFLAYVPILASETLATFLGVVAVFFLVKQIKGDGRHSLLHMLIWASISGVLMGTNLLVRPSGLFFLPGMFAIIALRSELSWRQRSLGIIAFSVLIALVLSPWLARNEKLGLGLTLSTVGGWNLYMGNNDKASTGGHLPIRLPKLQGENDAKYDQRHAKAAIDWILSNPARYARLSFVRLCRLLGSEPDSWAANYLWPTEDTDRIVHSAYWSRKSGHPDPELIRGYHSRNTPHRAFLKFIKDILSPLGLLALALAFVSRRKFLAILLPWSSYIFGLSLTIVSNRYVLPSEPLLYILIGALISDLLWRSKEFPHPARHKTKVIIAIAIFLTFATLEGTGVLKKLYKAPVAPAPKTSLSK